MLLGAIYFMLVLLWCNLVLGENLINVENDIVMFDA